MRQIFHDPDRSTRTPNLFAFLDECKSAHCQNSEIYIAAFRCDVEFGCDGASADVTATTDFLVNKCGRAVPAPSDMLTSLDTASATVFELVTIGPDTRAQSAFIQKWCSIRTAAG